MTSVCRFDVSAEDILDTLASPEIEVEPLPDIELPPHLVDPTEIDTAVQVRRRVYLFA